MRKLVSLVNGMALMFAMSSVNMACTWIFHQPELPKEAEKFRKR